MHPLHMQDLPSKSSVLDTIHVNLWGIPGTKRAVASELHAMLTHMGVEAALVHEYAKELGWAGQLARLDGNGDLVEVDQFVISAEQYRRENLVHGTNQIVITDAPVLAGALYAQEDDEMELRSILRRRTSGWRNLDVLLVKDVEQRYGSRGRIQSREDALAMLPRLEALLHAERPSFVRLAVENAASAIVPMVVRALKHPSGSSDI